MSSASTATKRGIERFTTVTMLQLETDLITAYRNGMLTLRPATDDATVRTEIALWQHHTGNTIGDDQEQFVRHLVTTSDRFVLGVGPAGTGKTVSIALACRAWEAAGFEPIGVTVTGAATDVLADTCGIPTRTVASLVTELRAGSNPLRPNSVLVVDEASTLPNRDHAALVRAVIGADARMVTIGDPSKHRSVEAGGLWAQLLQERDLRVLTLDENRRQASPSMADVRLAGQLLRTGRGGQAVELLTGSNRLTTATHAADLVASIVSDWHHDHTKHLADGTAPSRMMAEHHSTRRLLNGAAQDRLRADGLIRGPGTLVGSERLYEGDEIITRAQNRDVQFGNGRFLRNGMVGHVLAINDGGTGASLTVQFPGFGIVELPSDWLQHEVRPGLAGAAAPAYAITTHVAQGQTMDAGRAVITDGSTPEATYVALTRGRSDARLTYSTHLFEPSDASPRQKPSSPFSSTSPNCSPPSPND
jgi:ATP-dependent exoDNAse (exonuclease V) alpha subunit